MMQRCCGFTLSGLSGFFCFFPNGTVFVWRVLQASFLAPLRYTHTTYLLTCLVYKTPFVGPEPGQVFSCNIRGGVLLVKWDIVDHCLCEDLVMQVQACGGR